jgi:glycerophosphoryl diester phosphodiesterase
MSSGKSPIIIGHRGACGYRPEHTLASYQLAIEMGADYIEPDIVPTKDGVLIARHENNISQTTNVSHTTEFANRQTTKIIDGKIVTGWFAEDFTLEEIKTLRVKERLPFRSHSFEEQFPIPTLQEIIDLVKKKSTQIGRQIGIYPETKHPTYFQSISLSLEEPLVAILEANGYKSKDDPVFIQSFEVENLKQLNQMTALPLVQLLAAGGQRPYDFIVNGDSRTYAELTSVPGLEQLTQYADAIGPDKKLLIPTSEDNWLQPPTPLIDQARAVGLEVHTWTFRNEQQYLALDYQANPEAEYEQFFQLGLDGVFSDFPDTAVRVRDRIFYSSS